MDAHAGIVLNTIRATGVAAPIAVDVSANYVYVAAGQRVLVLDARRGTLVSSIDIGATVTALAVDERRGRVYVASQSFAASIPQGSSGSTSPATGPGYLIVLDAASSRILRRLRVGIDPRAIAVDERSGHVFIIDAGGTTRRPGTWDWLPEWLRNRLPVATQTTIANNPGDVMMLNADP